MFDCKYFPSTISGTNFYWTGIEIRNFVCKMHFC